MEPSALSELARPGPFAWGLPVCPPLEAAEVAGASDPRQRRMRDNQSFNVCSCHSHK